MFNRAHGEGNRHLFRRLSGGAVFRDGHADAGPALISGRVADIVRIDFSIKPDHIEKMHAEVGADADVLRLLPYRRIKPPGQLPGLFQRRGRLSRGCGFRLCGAAGDGSRGGARIPGFALARAAGRFFFWIVQLLLEFIGLLCRTLKNNRNAVIYRQV